MKNLLIKRMVLAGFFLALGFVLPFITGSIPELGMALLPMHIPVLLCGFICGWPYGLLVGFITPLLRSLLLSMPPMYPMATAMAFELGTYGLVAGLMNKLLPKKNIYIYISLITSMVLGRIVWGLSMLVFMQSSNKEFLWDDFITGAVLGSIPGIVIQIILIPLVLIALRKARLTLKV